LWAFSWMGPFSAHDPMCVSGRLRTVRERPGRCGRRCGEGTISSSGAFAKTARPCPRGGLRTCPHLRVRDARCRRGARRSADRLPSRR
jgi:hypothetical protein